jgi:hypothetical protein
MPVDPVFEHEPLSQYKAMWTTEMSDWVLVREDPADSPSSFLLPFHLTTRSALILDDQTVAETVVSRMLRAGVPVVTTLPDP